MAFLFGKKEEKERSTKESAKNSVAEASQKKVEKKAVSQLSDERMLWIGRRGHGNIENILKKPRITEKSTLLSEKNVYTFHVSTEMGKNEVAKAFKKIYGKTPVKVNMLNTAKKQKRTRFGIGTRGGKKKALVYLKRGETIDFA